MDDAKLISTPKEGIETLTKSKKYSDDQDGTEKCKIWVLSKGQFQHHPGYSIDDEQLINGLSREVSILS